MKGYGCKLAAEFQLFFTKVRGGAETFAQLCCEKVENRPFIALGNTGEETIKNVLKMRASLLEDGMRIDGHLRARLYGCEKCCYYVFNDWENSECITYINLSIYPSTCNSKCIYCSIHYENGPSKMKEESTAILYSTIFDAIDYADSVGLISPKVIYDVACGEITINPYRERIFNLVKNHVARFYTNCFVYDDAIALNLSTNIGSCINLSIDSGTAETWHKVKGVDNFNNVITNLSRYRENCISDNQLSLKYIVMPDINDSFDDYFQIVELMKSLNIKNLVVSSDARFMYGKTEEQKKKLCESTGRLISMLVKDGLTYMFQIFLPDEIALIELFVQREVGFIAAKPSDSKNNSIKLNLLAKNTIFYGAGYNTRVLMQRFKEMNIPFDYPIWDINAGKIKNIDGHLVVKPDFETAVCNTAAVITISDYEISQDVAKKLADLGFTVLYGNGEFLKYFLPQ